MRCLPFAVMLFCSSVVHADLFTAQKAFERNEFAKANAELLPLLPLGNAEAAFKLGHMAKAGQGQDKDLVKAYAYFKYADANAFTLAKAEWLELEPSLSAKDKKQANIMLAQLQTQTKIKREDMLKHWAMVKAKKSLQPETNKNTPEPLLRISPKYPVRAAQEGLSGFIKFGLLVNKQGDVTAVNILKSYPQGMFDREIIRAAKRWKYKPSPNNWLKTMWFEFSLDAENTEYSSSNLIITPELIDLAKKGSAQHQYDLANIIEYHTNAFFDSNTGESRRLSYLDPNLSAVSYTLNPSDFVPPQAISPLALRLNVPKELSTPFFVSVDDGGRITDIKFDEQETLSIDIKPFFGHQLTEGNIKKGFYKVEREGEIPRLYPAKRVPSDAYVYWLEHAARNGHKKAQHELAFEGSEWETYLLEQKNPLVQTWVGARLVLDGKKAEGQQLLDAAISQGYQDATVIKADLLQL